MYILQIRARSGNDKVKAMSLDLSSLKSIQQCAEDLKGVTDKIDILVNNAGKMEEDFVLSNNVEIAIYVHMYI
jgi:NADP-dependent 3-hydroxy acid dehydrogenase YdfG